MAPHPHLGWGLLTQTSIEGISKEAKSHADRDAMPKYGSKGFT